MIINKIVEKKNNIFLAKRSGHILFIVENNNVPTDIRVWREANTLSNEGYRVTIISPVDRSYRQKKEKINNIEIYRHKVIKKKNRKLNLALEYINAFIWELFLSLKIYLKKPFGIIHGANPPDNIFLIAMLFKMLGVKYIFDHHDLAPELYKSKFSKHSKSIYYLLRLMEKLSCRFADAVISTNQSYRSHIIFNHGINSNKIFVVRNDPDIENEPAAVKNKNFPNKGVIKIIYVGAINIQDGAVNIIEVINILVNKLNVKNLQCTIVGDGTELNKIKSRSKSLSLEKYITFTGYVFNRNLVKEYIKKSDICIETAPNIEANRKSTFIKIMEYMAAGKPIVAFDLPETRFSVGEAALLIDNDNILEFANAVKKLAEDSRLRDKLGYFGIKRTVEMLNWKNSEKELIKCYTTLK